MLETPLKSPNFTNCSPKVFSSFNEVCELFRCFTGADLSEIIHILETTTLIELNWDEVSILTQRVLYRILALAVKRKSFVFSIICIFTNSSSIFFIFTRTKVEEVKPKLLHNFSQIGQYPINVVRAHGRAQMGKSAILAFVFHMVLYSFST